MVETYVNNLCWQACYEVSIRQTKITNSCIHPSIHPYNRLCLNPCIYTATHTSTRVLL